MPLERQFIDVPFSGALDQHAAAEILAPGWFTVVRDGEWSKRGKIRKRPGVAADAAALSSMRRLAVFEDQLLGLDDSAGGNVYHRVGGTSPAWQAQGRAPYVCVRRKSIGRDMSQPLRFADVAYCNGWILYTWETQDDGEIRLVIEDATTGAIVYHATVSAATSRSPRLAVSGTAVLLTYVYTAGIGVNTIACRRIDCSATPPTVGAAVVLVADVYQVIEPIRYDLTGGLSAGRFAITYRQNATNDLVTFEVTAAPAVGWSATIVAAVSGCGITLSGANVFVAWADSTAPDLQCAAYNAATGAVVLAATVVTTPETAGVVGLTPHANGTDVVVVWGYGGTGTDGARWTDVTPAGVVGTINATFRIWPVSKPFTRDGLYWGWVRTNTAVWTSGVDAGYALVEYSRTAGVLARPVAAAAYLVSPDVAGTHASRLGHVANVGTQWHTMVPAVLTAGEINKTGQDRLTAVYSHPALWQPVQFGKDLYLSGGIVSQYDGSRLVENGIVQPPQISITATGGAGTGVLNPGAASPASFQYVGVYEYIDARGQRTRSAPSNVATGTLAGVANGSFTVSMMPLTLTMRQTAAGAGGGLLPRVLLTLYRTEMNLTTFYRLFTVDAHPVTMENTPFATVAVAWADDAANPMSDATIISHEALYTTGGALPNDTPWGGVAYLFRSATRLWGVDGEDGEVVWYSKEFVEGEPAQFSIGLQLRVPGERIQCGEDLDGAKILFSDDTIYLVTGDGPNDTGAPESGLFSPPSRLPSDAGCGQPRSLLSCPRGLLFRSRRGFCLLDRSRQVQYIGLPVETDSTAFPVVAWSCIQADRGLALFHCTDASGEGRRTLVYDYVEDKWAVRYYLGGTALLTDGLIYQSGLTLLRSNGATYRESLAIWTDAGTGYGQQIETGWINWGSLQGFKRCWRTLLQFQRRSAHGLRVEFGYDYDPTYVAGDTVTLSAAQTLAAGSQIRKHMRRQKLESLRLRITELDPTAGWGEGFEAIGMSFELGVLPGGRKLPAAATF